MSLQKCLQTMIAHVLGGGFIVLKLFKAVDLSRSNHFIGCCICGRCSTAADSDHSQEMKRLLVKDSDYDSNVIPYAESFCWC